MADAGVSPLVYLPPLPGLMPTSVRNHRIRTHMSGVVWDPGLTTPGDPIM